MNASAGGPIRVLIIDDSEISREAMRSILEPTGWDVQTLESPLGATAAVVRFQTNVLVVDVNMPIMSGGRFGELVRKNVRLNHVRLVLVSGDSEAELKRLGEQLGADAVLTKKVLAEKLAPTIAGLFTASASSGTPASSEIGREPDSLGTILVLDSDAVPAMEVTDRLERIGYQVVHRRTGRGGLLSMLDSRPVAVFVAVTIRDIPARIVIELIRENRAMDGVPVVLLGDGPDSQLAAEARRLGARGHLPRSLDEGSFRERVERILSNH